MDSANGVGVPFPGLGPGTISAMPRPPKDPHDIVAYSELIDDDGVDGRVPVRVIDVIVETLRHNGFMHDAAARAGISTETLRTWRRKGADASKRLLKGEVRPSQLDGHTKRCVELAAAMNTAEADARVNLLRLTTALASGGLQITKVIERIDATDQSRVLERRVEITETLPDIRALTWLLSHRYPHDFAERDLSAEEIVRRREPARDRLLAAIRGVQERSNGGVPIDVEHRPVQPNNGETAPSGTM